MHRSSLSSLSRGIGPPEVLAHPELHVVLKISQQNYRHPHQPCDDVNNDRAHVK